MFIQTLFCIEHSKANFTETIFEIWFESCFKEKLSLKNNFEVSKNEKKIPTEKIILYY